MIKLKFDSNEMYIISFQLKTPRCDASCPSATIGKRDQSSVNVDRKSNTNTIVLNFNRQPAQEECDGGGRARRLYKDKVLLNFSTRENV